ncbi:MAG: hypothetical protein ACLR8P_17225 [Clostridium fessum]
MICSMRLRYWLRHRSFRQKLENPDLTREKREDLVRSLFPLAVRESSRCWHRIRQ